MDNATIAQMSLDWAAKILKDGKYAVSRKITEEAAQNHNFALAEEWSQVNHELYKLESALIGLSIKVEKLAERVDKPKE